MWADRIAPPLRERLAAIRFVVFDFDGVFTDNTVLVHQDGSELVRCWRSDGLGLRKLERLAIGATILSTETNPVVSVRAAKLRIDCVQGLEDKCGTLVRIVNEREIPLAQTLYVGNDINDADCLRAVGVAVVVADAHPDVVALAHYQTHTPGGRGAVREVCDLLEWVHDR